MSERRSVYGLLVFFGLLLLCFAFAYMVADSGDDGAFGRRDGPRVGVVELTGVIEDSKRALEELRELAARDGIKAVVLRIDSPGGAVGPSQEIYREVQRTRQKKPVVASMGAVAASGGYYVAAACVRIVASAGTLTGSIGVITQLAEVSELLRLARLNTAVFKSGRFKDTGSPLRPLGDEDRALLQELVDGVHQQFVKDVLAGRQLKPEALAAVADGRVLTGVQARDLKLVDQLGNFSDALDLAAKLAGAKGEAVAVYPRKRGGFLRQILEDGIDGLAQQVRASLRQGARVEVRDPLLR